MNIPLNSAGVPIVQPGPAYRCFECGKPTKFRETFGKFLANLRNPSPLDKWADHIWYMTNVEPERCPCPKRVARLGDCITMLSLSSDRDLPNYDERVAHNIAEVKEALTRIMLYIPEDERTRDEATQLVYGLWQGDLTPTIAIEALQALITNQDLPDAVAFLLHRAPINAEIDLPV
jgi:hypothetical protein